MIGKSEKTDLQYQQHDFDYEKVVSKTWRDFVEYNTSIDFKNELMSCFPLCFFLNVTEFKNKNDFSSIEKFR